MGNYPVDLEKWCKFLSHKVAVYGLRVEIEKKRFGRARRGTFRKFKSLSEALIVIENEKAIKENFREVPKDNRSMVC